MTQETLLPATGPAALDHRTSRRRIALFAAPWVLAALLGAAAVGTRVVTSGAADERAVVASPSASPDAVTAATAPPDAVPPPSVPPTDPAATLTGAEVLAVLEAARASLGTAGLVGGTSPDRWPLETVLGEVTPVTATLHVATVHALVITAREDGWSAPSAAAVAVPLGRTADGWAVAGTPWPVETTITAALDPVPTRVVDDPDPAVVDALLDLGWQVEAIESVELLDGVVLALRLVGVPPGGGPAAEHRVWLLDAPGGPRPVTPPPPPPTAAPAAATTPAPTPMPQEAP